METKRTLIRGTQAGWECLLGGNAKDEPMNRMNRSHWDKFEKECIEKKFLPEDAKLTEVLWLPFQMDYAVEYKTGEEE